MSGVMPIWQGWSEQQVRRKPSNVDSSGLGAAQDQPAMAGFTAINAPTKGTSPLAVTTGNQSTDRTHNALAGHQRGHQQNNEVVAEYLGRGSPNGETSEVKRAMGPLRGPGTKKAAAKGKKRQSNAREQSDAKRRKTSNVSDGMSITKTSSQTKTRQRSDLAKPEDWVQSHCEGLIDSSVTPKVTELPQRHSAQKFQPGHHSSQAVPIFAPSTSMSSLQASSQQTSVEALRSATGHSTTIYQGAQRAGARLGIQTNKRRPDHASMNQSQASAEANTRNLRARKDQVDNMRKPSGTEEHHDADVLVRPLPVQTLSNKNASKANFESGKIEMSKKSVVKTTSRTKHSTAVEARDCFFDEDDDDMTEALNLVVNLEGSVEPDRKTNTSSPAIRQLPTPSKSDTHVPPIVRKYDGIKRKQTPLLTPDEEFLLLGDDEADCAEEIGGQRLPTPPMRARSLNIRNVDLEEDHGEAWLSHAESQLLDTLKSSSQATTDKKPLVRKPFPDPILDRSLVFGASNTTLLRTCFRLGEALNIGSQAVRTKSNVILEVYARVKSSYLEQAPGRKQHFVLKDLYHDTPPYLGGTCELWRQSKLWELDSRVFLKPREGGIMCRVIGKMKRDADKKLNLEMLSIWEASWEDVDFVAGIHARAVE